MKNTPYLIAVVCGLVTALLFFAPLSLGVPGMVLSTFTTMPLFVSVLGFGTLAGVVSGVVASLAVAVLYQPLIALSLAAATLGPALWIGHMAGLSRADDGTEEWFPLSTIFFRMTLMSAAIAIAFGMVAGYSTEWATQQFTAMMTEFVKNMREAGSQNIALDADEIARRSAAMASLIPLIMPVSILFLMVVNLALGARIARRQGWMLRPRDDIPATASLPVIAVAILAGASVAAFSDGMIGLLAKVVAGTFGGAFAFIGLATMHFLLRGNSARGLMLSVTYFVLLFSQVLTIFFAIFGLAETLLGLRARRAAKTPTS